MKLIPAFGGLCKQKVIFNVWEVEWRKNKQAIWRGFYDFAGLNLERLISLASSISGLFCVNSI
jgi:hypothetical protein